MTSTLRPIRTCAWNVGGGWLAGAEANLPHVLDALSHGGPMANIDILILTEAKLQDFTTVRSISQRLHFAASHNHIPVRCTESDKTCAARCSFFALCTHMCSTRFTPWGGVIIAVLNPKLAATYVTSSKAGLLQIRVRWKKDADGPNGERALCHPLDIIATYNAGLASPANTSLRARGRPDLSTTLYSELRARISERRLKSERIVQVGDHNMRLGTKRHAPTAAPDDIAVYPTRSTADVPSSSAAARTDFFAAYLADTAMTIPHGSNFAHQAAAAATSRPVARSGAAAAAEVDAFVAPWSAVRAAPPIDGRTAPEPLYAVARDSLMKFPPEGTAAASKFDVPHALTHTPIFADLYVGPDRRVGQPLPEPPASGMPEDHQPHLRGCNDKRLRCVPYSDRQYYSGHLPAALVRWADSIAKLGPAASSEERDARYADAVTSLQKAARNPTGSDDQHPSHLYPDKRAAQLRRENRRHARKVNRFKAELKAIGCTHAPTNTPASTPPQAQSPQTPDDAAAPATPSASRDLPRQRDEHSASDNSTAAERRRLERRRRQRAHDCDMPASTDATLALERPVEPTWVPRNSSSAEAMRAPGSPPRPLTALPTQLPTARHSIAVAVDLALLTRATPNAPPQPPRAHADCAALHDAIARHGRSAKLARREHDSVCARARKQAVADATLNLERARVRNQREYWATVNKIAGDLSASNNAHSANAAAEAPPMEKVYEHCRQQFTETRPPLPAATGAWNADTYRGAAAPPLAPRTAARRPRPKSCAFPTARNKLATLIYLLLFPVTRAFAGAYEPICDEPDGCPLCTDFTARITRFLSRRTALTNRRPRFPGRLKTSRAAGSDSLTIDLIAFGGPAPDMSAYDTRARIVWGITSMVGEWLDAGAVPRSADFDVVTYHGIPKPTTKDPADPAQNRPISVDNPFAKLLDAVFNTRATHHMASRPGLLSPSQIGGQIYRGPEFHVLNHRATIMHANAMGQWVVVLYIDVRGAYTSINLPVLQHLLPLYDFPDDFVKQLMTSLGGRSLCIRQGKRLSAKIALSKGVQQGAVEAPLLWSIYYDPLIRRLERLLPGVTVKIGRRNAAIASSTTTTQGFVDDLSIYLAFDFPASGTDDERNEVIREALAQVLAITADYERAFGIAFVMGEKKTEAMLHPPQPPATAGEIERLCSPAIAPIAVPPPLAVWDEEASSRTDSSPLLTRATYANARLLHLVPMYKYLGDRISHELNSCAEAVRRTVSSLHCNVTRLFSYNRAVAGLSVAAKIQLLTTLATGAASYLSATYKPTALQAQQIERPIRRAMKAILGAPSRALSAIVDMEGPAVIPIATISIANRARLAYTLALLPPYANNPAAALARAVMREPATAGGTSSYAPQTLAKKVAPVVGVRHFDELQSDIERIAPTSSRARCTWAPPTTLAAVLPRVLALKRTAVYDAIGQSAFTIWRVRGLPHPDARATRSAAVASTPTHALVQRPPSHPQTAHAAWLYHATHRAPPEAAGNATAATPLSWIGPGGAGTLISHCLATTATASVVTRARFGAAALDWYPWTMPEDVETPLNPDEEDAVCRVCNEEQPESELVLCSAHCGQGLHWLNRCIDADRRARDNGNGNAAPRPTAAGQPPRKPRKWFCSRDCADWCSEFYTARREQGITTECLLCPPAQDAPHRTDDLWHILFECTHPDITVMQAELDTSVAALIYDTLRQLEKELARRKVWFPGDDTGPAQAAIRAAGEVISTRREIARTYGAVPAPPPVVDRHCTYRLILALPFPEAIVPQRPPDTYPFDRAEHLAPDQYAVSRAMGRVFDSTVLTNVLVRRPATLIVNWASRWITSFAEARRRLRAARAGRTLDGAPMRPDHHA